MRSLFLGWLAPGDRTTPKSCSDAACLDLRTCGILDQSSARSKPGGALRHASTAGYAHGPQRGYSGRAPIVEPETQWRACTGTSSLLPINYYMAHHGIRARTPPSPIIAGIKKYRVQHWT